MALARAVLHVDLDAFYRTQADIHHDDNPFFFVREALPQVFPVAAGVVPCR